MIKIIKYILVFLCMLSIFLFSSDSGVESTKKSDGVIVHICEFFAGRGLSREERKEKVEKYVFIVRKSAHFLIYFILGFLLISLVEEYRLVDYKSFLIAFIIAFLYACSDEVHQVFIAGRNGKILDVFIDSIGSCCGIIIYMFLLKIRRLKNG